MNRYTGGGGKETLGKFLLLLPKKPETMRAIRGPGLIGRKNKEGRKDWLHAGGEIGAGRGKCGGERGG